MPSVEPDWPVVYVNPAPTGTLLLILSGDDSGPSPTAEARFVEATSTEILMRLISGDGAEPGASLEDGASYLLSLSGGGTAELQAALDQLLPWLGQTIAMPIAEELRSTWGNGRHPHRLRASGPRAGARRAMAVGRPTWAASPTSSISASLPRPSSAARRCGVQRESGPRVSSALADPDGDLPAARPEVTEIAALFGSSNANVAVGSDATDKFLRRHAARATHLHLACHARGGLFDATEAAILLASGLVPAANLTSLSAARRSTCCRLRLRKRLV